jgi:hypothetical protein
MFFFALATAWRMAVPAETPCPDPPIAIGERLQALLGQLDHIGGGDVGVSAEGKVDGFLADVDHLAPDPGVADGFGVFPGVDDADHGRQQLGEIGHAARRR